MSHDESEPRKVFERASTIARNELPEGLESDRLFRRFECWAMNWRDLQFTLPQIQNAVTAASGRSDSVWAFLRYHDYARARRDANFVDFASRQNDLHEPLYVYWQVNRSAVIFQQSQQPEIARDDLNLVFTAQYVAGAIDCAGNLYKTLGVEEDVTFRIVVTGIVGPFIGDIPGGGRFPDHDLQHESTVPTRALLADRESVALRALQDLLYQCGVDHLRPEFLVVPLQAAFARSDQRRVEALLAEQHPAV